MRTPPKSIVRWTPWTRRPRWETHSAPSQTASAVVTSSSRFHPESVSTSVSPAKQFSASIPPYVLIRAQRRVLTPSFGSGFWTLGTPQKCTASRPRSFSAMCGFA